MRRSRAQAVLLALRRVNRRMLALEQHMPPDLITELEHLVSALDVLTTKLLEQYGIDPHEKEPL